MRFITLIPFQAFFRPKHQFSLFFVSYFTAKLLHLGSHASSLPILLYVLYLPTFLLPDFLLLVVGKVLIYTQNGNPTLIQKFIGYLLALFTAGCSAAQIAFFLETGGEIQWMAADRVLSSGGLGLLLSGLPTVTLIFGALYGVAWIITPKFYDSVDFVLGRISAAFRQGYSLITKAPRIDEAQISLIGLEEDRSPSPVDRESFTDNPKTPQQPLTPRSAVAISFTTLTAIIVVIILQLVRPRSPPYAHMSGSLPITLVEDFLFQPINSEFCLPHPVEPSVFPFERFHAFFNSTQTLNWMPQSLSCTRDKGSASLPWLDHSGDEELAYSPRCDPLKLSNLNASLIQNLGESMKTQKPRIKNILLITLESTRKDMFPFKKGSRVYETILSTYTSPNAKAELDAKLANLTRTAAFLTGESTGFDTEQEIVDPKSWKSAFKNGMGSVNVEGSITQAAYTFKSLVSSHCGVEPLPVDFTEETKGRIYQACLPHILEQLNHSNDTNIAEKTLSGKRQSSVPDYRADKWSSTLIQSVTDQFDNQDILDKQMGFNHTITEAQLSDEHAKYYPPKQPWLNYFGLPETETMSYFRDIFLDGRQQGKRVFTSHITSTPHHPFATPKDWAGKLDYLNKQHWRPNDPLDDYLNTIKYQDDWISEIFQMLHDVDALQETLVVMTGDHGLAFSSVDESVSTLNNGHLSNFAVPLLFIHPDLPRTQIRASTSQLSIIPTILDLLAESESLTTDATATARALLPLYQGNSLIRELDFSVPTTDGSTGPAFFQPFHFSAINPGGAVITIADASTTFRLLLPLCSTSPLRFTDTAVDPGEQDPIIAWTIKDLVKIVKAKHGARAKEWAMLAEELGRWWVWNQRTRWGYWGVARSTARGGAESGRGQIKHKHWWET